MMKKTSAKKETTVPQSTPLPKVRIMLAQLNMFVGNLQINKEKILQTIEIAKKQSVDIVMFPEMSLTGYPIQDLIFDNDFLESELQVVKEIAQKCTNITAIVGGFDIETDLTHHPKYQNVAFILRDGQQIAKIQKRLLPTYDVFDEKRYFWSGNNYAPFEFKEKKFGIAICEDLWDDEYTIHPAQELVAHGAHIILSINASPFTADKQKIREDLVIEKSKKFHVPILYVNLIGGQDDLIFDGRSFVSDLHGKIVRRMPYCKEALMLVDLDLTSMEILPFDTATNNLIPNELRISQAIESLQNPDQDILDGLALNLRDYYHKSNVFKGIVLGVSGGIDSAFTAYIAVKAIGPEKVTGILMPSRFSSKGSIDDSIKLCSNLGIKYITAPIKDPHALLVERLNEFLPEGSDERSLDLTDQNLQARIRAIYLMYYSNKYNYLLVSTGDKSEIAAGFCTLYGDTCGGKNIPGDLYKTDLYRIVDWINREKEIIPHVIRMKKPSPELKPGQIAEDTLPPYEVLDEILRMRIDEGLSPREIIAKGKDSALVYRIESLYMNSEYKRAQLAQTIKVHKKAFGSGRKIPVLKKAKY